MRLEPTPRPERLLRVSTRLITSSAILQLSNDELERTVNQEQIENPALNVTEHPICLLCGTPLYGQFCPACGHFNTHTPPGDHELATSDESLIENENNWLATPPSLYGSLDSYEPADLENEDQIDPLARISTSESLQEMLLHQLEALIPPDEAAIAEQLVGSLNGRGYLDANLNEIAYRLRVPVERVEYVLSQLHTLEPLGIGARNVSECLRIQFDAISEQKKPPFLTYTLIDHYLDLLGHKQYQEIARQLKVHESDVRQAAHFISTSFNPSPASAYHESDSYTQPGSEITYIHPDVIIRRGENGLEIELIEETRYSFQVGTTQYRQQADMHTSTREKREIHRYLHHQTDQARFFVECVKRRWVTLKRVAELVVDYQREFLEKGIRYLRPLTRAEIASRLALDEGTVSRATANKYVLLPNGRLMPFSDFFDSSLSIKDVLRELIQTETPGHRLSDEELARMLTAHGMPMARRTVTKYREEMGIGSSRERTEHV